MRHRAAQRWASAAGLLSLPARQAVGPDTLAARIAIGELFARYGLAYDEVNAEALSDLFTAEAVLEVSLAGPPFERHQGRDAILANFAAVAAIQNDQRRHAISNVEIGMTGRDRATARAYGLISATDGMDLRLAVACVYAAGVALEPDGLWRFERLWIGMDDYAGPAPGTCE